MLFNRLIGSCGANLKRAENLEKWTPPFQAIIDLVINELGVGAQTISMAALRLTIRLADFV
jgi:hypothetical protein